MSVLPPICTSCDFRQGRGTLVVPKITGVCSYSVGYVLCALTGGFVGAKPVAVPRVVEFALDGGGHVFPADESAAPLRWRRGSRRQRGRGERCCAWPVRGVFCGVSGVFVDSVWFCADDAAGGVSSKSLVSSSTVEWILACDRSEPWREALSVYVFSSVVFVRGLFGFG